MKKINLIASTSILIGLLGLQNCISFASSGLGNLDTKPDKNWIGRSYADLVQSYGAPTRVYAERTGSRDNSEQTDTQKDENESASPDRARKFMALYKSQNRSTYIIYQHMKEYSYTFTVENNRIVAFNSILSGKLNGVSLSVSMPITNGPGAESSQGPRN